MSDMAIQDACKILFGDDFRYSNKTVNYLQKSGIESAFKKRVKLCHPDRALILNKNKDELEEEFKIFYKSYKTLLDFVEKRTLTVKDISEIRKRPKRKLKIGEFLYYSNIISKEDLINAISYSRKSSNKIGRYFLDNKIISKHDFYLFLTKQVIYNISQTV